MEHLVLCLVFTMLNFKIFWRSYTLMQLSGSLPVFKIVGRITCVFSFIDDCLVYIGISVTENVRDRSYVL